MLMLALSLTTAPFYHFFNNPFFTTRLPMKPGPENLILRCFHRPERTEPNFFNQAASRTQ